MGTALQMKRLRFLAHLLGLPKILNCARGKEGEVCPTLLRDLFLERSSPEMPVIVRFVQLVWVC